MNRKLRYIPIVALGAILLSLLVIAPTFGRNGVIEFYQPTDTESAQSWTKQGGDVGIRLTDADLNVVVKKVLIPLLTAAGDVSTTTDVLMDVKAGDDKILVRNGDFSALANKSGDRATIVVGRETVRMVTGAEANTYPGQAASAATTTYLTVNKPFGSAIDVTVNPNNDPINPYDTDVQVYIVKETLIDDDSDATSFYDFCPTCALAESSGSFTTNRHRLADRVVVDSNIYHTATENNQTVASLANRFKGGSKDTFVDEGDILQAGGDAAAILNGDNTTLSNGTFENFDGNTQHLLYWARVTDTTLGYVSARSGQDSTGMTVVLTEKGSNSGVFEGVLMTQKADGTDMSKLKVGKEDTITVSYNDPSDSDDNQSAAIQVETTAPTFSGFTPANGASSKVTRPEVEADVTDVDSGIATNKKVEVLFGVDTDNDGDIDSTETVKGNSSSAFTSAIANGFHIRASGPNANNASIYWWVMATDDAGNPGVSDRQPQIDGAADDCDHVMFTDNSVATGKDVSVSANVYGCQPYVVRSDNSAPKMTNAYTGQFWDLTKVLGEGETDRTNTDATKADATQVRVEFDENINGATVQASDFQVAGRVALEANHYDGAKKSVFLTVPSLDPNETPEVKLVGEVEDIAGNRRSGATISRATDGIAPSLTVSLEGTTSGARPITKKSITVRIESDENVSAPEVTVYKINMDSDTDLDETSTTSVLMARSKITQTSSPVRGAARTYEAKIDRSEPGLYNVYVTAKDTAGGNNDGTAGTNKTPIDVDSSSVLLYEVDTGVAAYSLTPEATDDPNAFITVDYSGEGKEYPTEAGQSNDYDTYGSVTITSAVLTAPDGTETDITSDLTTSANAASNKFQYGGQNFAIGKYTLAIKAMDSAGNEDATAVKKKFEITARKAFSVTLNPGWNLVSLPSDPASTAINDVIPSDHPVSRVRTYDPSMPGGWLTARRGDDGMFAGTLTDLVATRAYWIQTTSFQSLDVDIPKPAPGGESFLPTVRLVKGWNLVPIIDVDGNFKLDAQTYAEDQKDADGNVIAGKKKGDTKPISEYNYFGSVASDITTIYTYNTVNNTWNTVAGNMVALGKGYWVYASASAVLVPQ